MQLHKYYPRSENNVQCVPKLTADCSLFQGQDYCDIHFLHSKRSKPVFPKIFTTGQKFNFERTLQRFRQTFRNHTQKAENST